jgi:hypothetical protein
MSFGQQVRSSKMSEMVADSTLGHSQGGGDFSDGKLFPFEQTENSESNRVGQDLEDLGGAVGLPVHMLIS